jgi:hypothetical protein
VWLLARDVKAQWAPTAPMIFMNVVAITMADDEPAPQST